MDRTSIAISLLLMVLITVLGMIIPVRKKDK